MIGLSVALAPVAASAIDICSGGNRAARKVTCVVDGDTIWQNGVKMRLLDIDTPETFEAQCDRERQLGEKAKLRLQSLMSKDIGWQTAARRIGPLITAICCMSSCPTAETPGRFFFARALLSRGRTRETDGARGGRAPAVDQI